MGAMDSWGFFGDGTRPVVVGHRGDPARFPDNTLAGVHSGLSSVGRVEVDVRLTRDGRLILSHDPVLGGMEVAAVDWSALAGLDLGGGHGPCLLDDALALPGRVDIEIKNLPFESAFDPHGALAMQVAARTRPGDLLTTFYWPDADLVRERSPGVATGLLLSEIGSVDDALAHAAGLRHGAVALHHSLVNAEVVSRAAEQDVSVTAWTVNEPSTARDLWREGVAAIISDHPEAIETAFREEGP